ncbi:phosphotriesterase family protein [Spirillospora albida]|uniref:phosphotriesterase family protein n=1 Tax=Spirillospora albida TaxID=58123 RepID=UPI0004C24F65|nr:aryldialkylphosphatase [Spirillospora albida]
MTPRDEPARLRTVTGMIEASEITGTVLAHEHLRLDLRWPERPRLLDSDARRFLDEEKAVQRELAELRAEHDLGLVIDLTCAGMGRDAAVLARISAGARVAVVAGTGVFAEPFHPPYVREALAGAGGVEKLAERFLSEIGFGLDGTGSLPGVIGEIGTWGEAPGEAEEACLRAAAQAARYSGLSIATYGRAGLAQLEILTGADVDPARVAIGRQDRVDDPAQHRKIAESGAYVSFGSLVLAGEDHAAIGAQVRAVMDLLEAGHADRVLISTGVSRMSHVARYGGVGFGHLFDVFVPALRAAGADDATLRTILHDNPLRWLTGTAG